MKRVQSVQVQSIKKIVQKIVLNGPKIVQIISKKINKKSEIGRIFAKTFPVQWLQQLRTYCYSYNLNKHAVPHDFRRSACLDKNVLTTYSTDIQPKFQAFIEIISMISTQNLAISKKTKAKKTILIKL